MSLSEIHRELFINQSINYIPRLYQIHTGAIYGVLGIHKKEIILIIRHLKKVSIARKY